MSRQLTALVLLAVMGSCGMYAAEMTRIDVYIGDSDSSAQLLRAGKVVASGIFEKIGVHLNWRTGKLADNAFPQKAFGIRTPAQARNRLPQPRSLQPGSWARRARRLRSTRTEF
jgi:hypothetical protein